MIGTISEIQKYISDKDENTLFEIKEYGSKRGNKANNYFHRLVRLLAKGEKKPFSVMKNELIARYGNHEYECREDGEEKFQYLPDDDEYKKDDINHYAPTFETIDYLVYETQETLHLRKFLLYKGTHTYSSKDFAYLIDCTRDECIGCDIPLEEIETPEERRFMTELRVKGEK